MQPSSDKPRTPPRITRERVIILVFLALAVLISLSTILGGLDNYQRLYEAGQQDPLAQTSQQAGPAAPQGTAQP
jgi:hypothetical protein